MIECSSLESILIISFVNVMLLERICSTDGKAGLREKEMIHDCGRTLSSIS